METDFDRLLAAAIKKNPQLVRNKITLAAFLDESPQSIGNWVKRGVPKDKLTSIARKIGSTAEWIETGAPPEGSNPSSAAPSAPASVEDILRALAERLKNEDPQTQSRIGDLLKDFAETPDPDSKIAKMIRAALD